MKIGISGIGYWGKKVLNEYITLKEEGLIEEIILFDTKQAALDNFKENSSLKIVNSYNELVNNSDAIHICTPNDLHYEQILIAFNGGRDVLVEKPVTKNSKTAFFAVERSLDLGLIFQVGNILRFSNSLIQAKKIIDSGYLGRVSQIIVHWSHISPSVNSTNEDVMWDLMPHVLDIMNFLFHEWPISFDYADSNADKNRGGFRKTANLLLKYDAGFQCSVTLSLLDHNVHRDIEISCENGTIFVNPVKQVLKIYKRGEEEVLSVDINNTIKDEIKNFIKSSQYRKNKLNSAFIGALVVREIERITEGM